MYIKFLKNTVADGSPRMKGTSAEISDRDARYLIASGSAEEAKKPKAKAKAKKAPVDRSVDAGDLESR